MKTVAHGFPASLIAGFTLSHDELRDRRDIGRVEHVLGDCSCGHARFLGTLGKARNVRRVARR